MIQREILENVFKRTVHNIMEQLHRYDLKRQTFIWSGFTFSEYKKGRILCSFWSSAIVSVLLKWIKDGMKVPAEKIAVTLPF